MSENVSFNNKIEQLQKLYQISILHIDKFGYKQFLKDAISTLRHKGFSILKSDSKRIQVSDELIQSDDFSGYPTWLNKQKYFKHNLKKDFKKTLL